MSRESSLAARVRERLIRKRAELATAEEQLATLLVRREALESGIAEDEALLTSAAPKKTRKKKTPTAPDAGSGSAHTEP